MAPCIYGGSLAVAEQLMDRDIEDEACGAFNYARPHVASNTLEMESIQNESKRPGTVCMSFGFLIIIFYKAGFLVFGFWVFVVGFYSIYFSF